MPIKKLVKKFTASFLASLCMLISAFSIFSKKVYAVTDYEVHVAIFCDNTILAKEYLKQLCSYGFDDDRRTLTTRESTADTEKTVIAAGYGSMRYNVCFHIINSSWVLHPNRELGDLIKACTGAIILYDISDPTLLPIVKSRTHYKEDVEALIHIETPLNNCIRYLQSFGRNGWWNALNFITYNKEQLEPADYEEHREQLNLYTGGLEQFYVNGDNKWSRGHPDWSTEGGVKNPLGWISGQTYRSIFLERSLTGSPGLGSKKKSDYSNPPVLPVLTVLPKVEQTPQRVATSPDFSLKEQQKRQESWEEICRWINNEEMGLKDLFIKARMLGMAPADLQRGLKTLIENLQEQNGDSQFGLNQCVVC